MNIQSFEFCVTCNDDYLSFIIRLFEEHEVSVMSISNLPKVIICCLLLYIIFFLF